MSRILLLLVFVCLPVVGQPAQNPSDEEETDTSTENADQPSPDYTVIFSSIVDRLSEVVSTLESITTNTAPDQNAERRRDGYEYDSVNLQHSDLRAQKSMARSTFWMAIFALVGVVMSFWGIILLYRNLSEAGKATRALVMAERANLVIGDGFLRQVGQLTGLQALTPLLSLDMELRNQGRTLPLSAYCLLTTTILDVVEGDSPQKSYNQIRSYYGVMRNIPIKHKVFTTEGSKADLVTMITLKAWDEIKAGRTRLYLHGSIQYMDVFQNKRFCNFGFVFMPRRGDDIGYRCDRLTDTQFWESN